ncbi:hypothetical protein EUTSA_v10019143mg [Eutrema salsugineum]|uniref:DUF962 domain-containing protein n=1 Tax=Eutrema salsugineum TaxID=72664 RepID=V4KD47_EUTSA|nr:hypothetical protein EUTSA_v10019143mg [Eutrema salsugineum]ESQ27712.1 hypothetical protein EUTSA_v10019143mg [Eutrema salsugineum]
MSNRIGLLDLEKHFAFYGAYHSNHINIIIHTLLVWPNVFATLLFLYSTSPILDPSRLGFIESLTCGGVLRLDIGFFLTVIFLAARIGHSLTFKVGVASQLLCWIGQFLGHGVFEKRAPALLDNLVQAFLMGPFFVLLEVLQSVFSYEPYPGFKARVNSKIESEIKEWREKKQKKKIT